MDTKIFVESFHEMNKRFVELLDSLSALRALSEIPMENQNEKILLEQALQTLVENQNLEQCSIFLLNDGRLDFTAGVDWWTLLGFEHIVHHSASEQKLTTAADTIEKAITTRNIQYCPDCSMDSAIRRTNENNPKGSLICIPIVVADTVYGVLTVYHPQNNFFNDTHERTLLLFSSFLGQILANYRHARTMEETIQNRTRQLEKALSEAQELKLRYHQLSIIDELTGLHNRRFFFPEAAAALSRAMRYGEDFCVLLLDLDHFKSINDTMGHSVGDEVLAGVAQLLQGETRYADILARFGGEEFVIALPHTNLSGAKIFAQRVLTRLANPDANTSLNNTKVTATIGLSTYNNDCPKNPEQGLDYLIRQADQALYFGKKGGRNQFNAYEEAVQELKS
jgi:diguanylate cyclase (GGDEF)-like protein